MIFVRSKKSTYRIGVIIPSADHPTGVINTFVSETTKFLQQLSTQHIELTIHTNLLNEKSLTLFAEKMRQSPHDLLWAISPLPQAQALKLHTLHKITIPTLITTYEHTIPAHLPEHISVLLACDDSKVVSMVLSRYVDSKRTAIICGRSSMLAMNPGISHLTTYLQQDNITPVLLPIDHHLTNLDDFMDQQGAHASIMRLTADPFTINNTKLIRTIAHRHNCKVFAAVTDAIKLGVDGVIGTHIPNMSKETAHHISSLINGASRFIQKHSYQRTIYLPGIPTPQTHKLCTIIPDSHHISFMPTHESIALCPPPEQQAQQ